MSQTRSKKIGQLKVVGILANHARIGKPTTPPKEGFKNPLNPTSQIEIEIEIEIKICYNTMITLR